MNGKGLGGLPLHFENGGVIPLEVLVCSDVNMTGVDFVKET